MSCEDYPTAQTAKTFKLDAETVNEVVTLEQDRTSDASDGKTKKTLWGIENDATNQRDEFEQLASDQRDNFEVSFNSQFNFKRIGNISDYAGQSLPEADKLNSYQYPDDSGDWYVPEQGQSFPITIPTNPTVAGSNWYLQSPSGVYRGLWPDTGGSANKGETYQTQTGGTPTGQYFTALQNTIVGPVSDDVNWREVISLESFSKYTDIVYSSVSDMVAGLGIAAKAGDNCSVGRSIYEAVSTSSVTPNGFNILQSTFNPLISFKLSYSNNIDIDEWGIIADGVTSDRDAINNLISFLEDGFLVDFRNKEIFLGEISDSDTNGLFLISLIDNLNFANKPRWKINNVMTGAVGELKIAPVFKFTDCENLTLTCDASGDQYDVNSPHGPAFYYVENDTKDTSGLYIDCNATNAVAACMIEQKTGSDKALYNVLGVNGGDNITYAHRPFQSGHNAQLTINAKNHARSYYPVGVSNQQVMINSENNKRVNDVLIKCYVGETSNIKVHINQKGSTSSEWPVLIEHENLNTSNVSAIKEVDVTLNTDKQYAGANPEFFAFRQRVTGGATAQTSLNTTDEIRLTLLGNQVSSANPKIAFLSGIATNNKGTFHTNMTDDVIDTRGFTFKKSDSIKIKRRGDLSSFTKQLYMQQINRSGVMILLTVSAFSDYTTGVGFVQTYGIRAFLDDLGGGVVNNFNKQYGWNDSGAPAVSVSFSNFNLVVDIASNPAYENSNSEICVTAQFISNI